MIEHSESEQRKSLLAEVQRTVDDARSEGRTLHTVAHAALLFARYPEAHFSVGRITDELVLAASRLGVPVEMARPEQSPSSLIFEPVGPIPKSDPDRV